MAATSAHTTSITAPGTSGGLITSVSINASGDDVLDASHLGQAAGSAANRFISPLTGYTEVSVSYIGDSYPESGDTGSLSVSGAISISMTNCICTSASVSGSVGELITVDATYRDISS